MNRWIVATLGVAGALATGCGGSDPSNAPGATQQGVLLGTGTPSPDEVSITGFVHASDGTLLGGAHRVSARRPRNHRLHRHRHRRCVLAARAQLQLGDAHVPAYAGYLPVLRPIATQDAETCLEGENALMPIESPQTFMWSAGRVQAKDTSSSSSWAPGSATPPPSSPRFPGPTGAPPTIYLDSTGAPASGAAGGTSGGFANLVAGMYVLRFSAGSAKCTANGAYGYSPRGVSGPDQRRSSRRRALVEAGTLTAPVGVTCTR